MITTDFMSLYEELSVLNEAKADIDNFINKFGQDTYELFKKSTQRLKNKGISTDLTYHIKNTDKKGYDIAYECGFSDPHYFSYIFKKNTGLTPREFKGI